MTISALSLIVREWYDPAGTLMYIRSKEAKKRLTCPLKHPFEFIRQSLNAGRPYSINWQPGFVRSITHLTAKWLRDLPSSKAVAVNHFLPYSTTWRLFGG